MIEDPLNRPNDLNKVWFGTDSQRVNHSPKTIDNGRVIASLLMESADNTIHKFRLKGMVDIVGTTRLSNFLDGFHTHLPV
jgi:hypothetical protein